MAQNQPAIQDGQYQMGRPTVADLRGDNPYAELAKIHWLGKSQAPKVKPEVLKTEIWDVLESEKFDFRSLLLLENLQFLESYLWPGYSEDSSNIHVLLIAFMVHVKARESLPKWNIFVDNASNFSSLFHRILSMTLDQSIALPVRTNLLGFAIDAFQSLDSALVRKECAPLVSISIWHNLAGESSRESFFENHSQLRKAWRASKKRYDAADDLTQARLRFERSWLFSMSLEFLSLLQEDNEASLLYCERYVEFLIDLQSQLPTRRYVNALLVDMNILPIIRLSPMFNNEENGLLRDLYRLFRHYVHFPIDSVTGAQASVDTDQDVHSAALAKLQRVSLKHFRSKLTILALSNYGSIDQRAELESHLKSLTDQELIDLCEHLDFRTSYPKSLKLAVNRPLLLEILIVAHERRKSFQEVAKELSILPTEESLFEASLFRNEYYNGSRPLAIPKLNLQYLTVGDFLWRSFILYRCETFFEIRKHLEDILKRLLQPRSNSSDRRGQFGFSKMAAPISKPAVIEVALAKVGDDKPAFVRMEIALDVSHMADKVRNEWDSLRQDDVVFLATVQEIDEIKIQMNGSFPVNESEKLGLRFLRAAEVHQVLDESGRSLRENRDYSRRPRLRRLLLNVDAASFKKDKERSVKGKLDIYETINFIIRRKGRENNFKPILESIQNLTLSSVPIPSWMQEVFLGFGDPHSANYTRLPNQIRSLDFRDTFINWEHLVQSFAGKVVEPKDDVDSSFPPPYILEIARDESSPKPAQLPKKRRRAQEGPSTPQIDRIRVSSYKPPNTGPYPTDVLKLNKVRFTPAQIEAIVSGTQPGLTIIIGPPGTGKTDVATQIINNLYHDFPEQRTLLVAHSNQALNQLFQKIVALDIDARHLLRLGHGEEELDTEESYSKHGRVESFLENRVRYLTEINRLAANFGAPGAHGDSCETADYFNSVYVKPAWTKFMDTIMSKKITSAEIVHAFPFHFYFSNAPQPLFPVDATREQAIEIAQGCYTHICKIFTELEDIRPFEILRTQRDKANYLLIKEARIIAMTSTHAAMRRQEIARLGFHYDNVVMEEAAQITEIETFIPLALQSVKDGELPLQRVVLCGDHLQNSPVIQNLAFRHYANLEQSLFLRFVRLGVPTIHLDQQGRARPSIAKLYSWRYERLGNLPSVETGAEFLAANAGFKYDYQFINVPDYKGVGEAEPSPHFIQNLGEAEYAVALYQYMRLLGYPASKISILTMYAGQRALIWDVLSHRCAKNPLFGLPKAVNTVDKYQGEQNDYIILSLTRTRSPGFLRDIRRMTVALSRARLGLYIFGRRDVFESCYELKEAFDRLLERPDTLQLVPGEIFPSARLVSDEVEATEMVSVEHLGQYVYTMTTAKMAALKGESVASTGDGDDMIIVDANNGSPSGHSSDALVI